MGFLKRKLSCFYCGRTSSESWQPGLRSFHCTICDATNYLDSKGDITDPPISTTASARDRPQYVQTSFNSRSPSPAPLLGSSGAVFCHTCTSNQQFVTQALAEYLPTPADPRYREYEKTLPEYKRQLESRYPQVCPDCEPRVQAQIQAAGYTARTDYIRRMNDKSRRAGGFRSPIFTKRRLVGIGAGCLWLLVLVVQIAWNGLGALAEEEVDVRDAAIPTVQDCASQCLKGLTAEHQCTSLLAPLVRYTLLLNMLVIWWNPILLRSTRRARGVGEFYKLQVLLLVLRMASWYILGRDSNDTLGHNTKQAIHGFMLLLNLIITIVSLSTARPLPYLVRFHKNEKSVEPMVETTRDNSRAEKLEPIPQKRPTSLRQTFPITSLAAPSTTPNKSQSLAHKSSLHPSKSPGASEGEVDAMDLDTPDGNAGQMITQGFFREGPTANPLQNRASKAAYRPPAPLKKPVLTTRQLRSRTRQTRPAAERTDNFTTGWDVETIASHAEEDALTIGADDDSEDGSSNTKFVPASAKRQRSYDFQTARLHSEAAETGLEGMLGFFGLRDDPLQSATSGELAMTMTEQPAQDGSHPMFSPPVHATSQGRMGASNWRPRPNIVMLHLLSYPVILLTMLSLGHSFTLLDCVRGSATWWCAVVALTRLLDALSPQRPIWELSNILSFVFQAATGVTLGNLHFRELRKDKYLTATATGPQDPVAIDSTENSDMLLGSDPAQPDHDMRSEISAVVNYRAVAAALLVWTVGQELIIMLRIFHERRRLQLPEAVR